MAEFAICFSFLLLTSVYFSEVVCNSSDYYPTDNEKVGMVHTFEGDMINFENFVDMLRLNSDTKDFKDNALIDIKKWVDGIVYYKISNRFSCNERCIIHEAMYEMERKTCLNFIEDDQRQDFISILPSTIGCASYIGWQGTRQQLYLAPECANVVGQVIHELMHAIGFLHEHSRIDRDDFININWNNIPELHYPAFIKYDLNNVPTYGLPYDYQSIMHYGPYAFAHNQTIMTITVMKQGQKIGQRRHLSDLDVRRINIHYNCSEKTIGCHDTMSKCRSNQNLEKSCRGPFFSSMCKRTCRLCSSRRQIQHAISNSTYCQTPADRCTKWINSHYGYCSHTDFRRTQRTNCYQSCNNCD